MPSTPGTRPRLQVLRTTNTGGLHSYPGDEISFSPGRGHLQVQTWRGWESWAGGLSDPSQGSIAERTGLDDDALLSEIRLLRQD